MLSKKQSILILAIALHCASGQTQENRLPLRFALTVGKTLINTPRSFIEVSSTKQVYVRKVNALPLSDTQCWPTEASQEQVCFGNNQPTRIRVVANDNLKISFHAPGLSQVEEAEAHRRAASDEGSDGEDSCTSDNNSDNCSNEDEADAESDVQYVTTAHNPFPVSNEISHYYANLVLKKVKQEPISDSEIPTLKTHKQRLRVYQCYHEGCHYSSGHTGNMHRHQQTHLPADQRPSRPRVLHCDHEGCHYRTDHSGNLKNHKHTHLPADQKPWLHQCDHEGCHYRTCHTGHMNIHKQIHLPADQRPSKPKKPKIHQCDHEDCNYSSDRSNHLKRHKQTHLPADQRPRKPKVHQCDHECCDYRTDHKGTLKRHKQTHLANQKPKRKAYGQPLSNQPLSNKKRKKGDKQ